MQPTRMAREIRAQYQRKRLMAQRRHEEKLRSLYESVPALEQIEEQMNRKGLDIGRLMLHTKDEERKQRLQKLKQELQSLKTKKNQLLKDLGLSESDLQVGYECQRCEDRGFLQNGNPCACYQQQLINRAYTMSNLSTVLERENFSQFQLDLFSDKVPRGEKRSPRAHMSNVLSICEGFVFNFREAGGSKPNLLFSGPTGLGKTFMANCIAKALLDRGHTVIYQTAGQLFSLLARHEFEEKQDPRTIQLLHSSDLLILDDLGTELTNSFTNSQLFQLVNSRHLARRRTLISTNLTPKDLMDRYDDRICSRVFAYYEFVKFFGSDLRWER